MLSTSPRGGCGPSIISIERTLFEILMIKCQPQNITVQNKKATIVQPPKNDY